MNKIKNIIYYIPLILILFWGLFLKREDTNRSKYSINQYTNYKIRILQIYTKSKILTEHIYKRIQYWKQQPKPKPKIIKNKSFLDRC